MRGKTSKRRPEDSKAVRDKINMELINSLAQPFIVRFCGGDEWPLYDLDVETGLLRIDVCGKLQVKHIGEAILFRDLDGVEHDVDTLYSDYVAPELAEEFRLEDGK